MDAFSRRVVGWAMATHLQTKRGNSTPLEPGDLPEWEAVVSRYTCSIVVVAFATGLLLTVLALLVCVGPTSAQCPGDFDNNGMVNIADFLSFSGVFGTSSGDANYNALMDMDGDGMIDIFDLLSFATVFDTTCEETSDREDICGRTVQVRDEILRLVQRTDCASVTRGDLAKLYVLDLQAKGITALKSGDFAGLDSLIILDLVANPLSQLPENIFSDLDNLEDLRIGHTELTALPSDVFAGLSNLEYLSVYYNQQLTELPSDVFAGLSNLHDCNLDANGLMALPVGVFADLANLQSLWLRGNQLTELPSGVFSGLTSLETLLLKSNRLSALPSDVFAGLTRLAELSLGHNELTALPDGLFSGLSNLRSLSLFWNPGAPFALTLELERTDSSNNLAPGPADVAVKIAEGAPFEITAELVVVNGSTSASTLAIGSGGTASAGASITGIGLTATHVGWGPVMRVPGGFIGVEIRTGNPLALFAESDKQWPVTEGNIPSHVLQVSGPEPELNVQGYFSDANGAGLTYSVASKNEHIVSASVNGSAITLMPKAPGETTVFVTATNPDGLSALQDISVTVLPVPDPNSFNIDLVFITPATEEVRSATRRMAERWTEVITGDLPDVSKSGDFADCAGWVADHRFFGTVDDLVVFVEIAAVSGGKGFGGPCGLRDGSFLPATGRFVLDSEVAAGDPSWTILHEIGHVLGFGTIWDKLGFLPGSGDDSHFNGPLAVAAFDAAGGVNYAGAKVPVSDDLGHWRGDAFGWGWPRELMMDGGGTLLSTITIQSLADLGYTVDVTRADPFRLPGSTKAAAIKTVTLRDDILRGPMSIVNENGRVVQVIDDGNHSEY